MPLLGTKVFRHGVSAQDAGLEEPCAARKSATPRQILRTPGGAYLLLFTYAFWDWKGLLWAGLLSRLQACLLRARWKPALRLL